MSVYLESLPSAGEKGLIAHTADPSKYHFPDARQQELGIRGTVIPRATTHGASRGCSIEPGIINVVSLADESPVTLGSIDLQKVSNEIVSQSIQQADGDPGKAMVLLGKKIGGKPLQTPKTKQQMAQRVNPVNPAGYVVPASAATGRQIQATELQAGQQKPAKIMASVEMPPSPSVRPKKAKIKPVLTQTKVEHTPEQLPEYVEAIVEQEPEQTKPVPARNTVSLDVVRNLGIDFLQGEPEPPKHRVAFNGGFGTMLASYHAVIRHKQALVLVLDNRFEFGQFYVPPKTNDEFTVTLVETQETLTVYNVDYSFSLGCLDFLCFVVSDNQTQQSLPSSQDLMDQGVIQNPNSFDTFNFFDGDFDNDGEER